MSNVNYSDLDQLIISSAGHRVNVVAIMATDTNGGIGLDDTLPNFPKLDLLWFKHNTENRICIVGSKTYATLPPLKKRKFIVITNNPAKWRYENLNTPNYQNVVLVSNKIDEAIDEGKVLSFKDNVNELMIIGGAEIYNYCFNNRLVDEIIHTKVKDVFNCNKFISFTAMGINYTPHHILRREVDGLVLNFYRHVLTK